MSALMGHESVAAQDGADDERYGGLIGATAFSSFLILSAKLVSAVLIAKSEGITVVIGRWRGWLPVASVVGFYEDFSFVVTWSTVATGLLGTGLCVVATIFKRRDQLARWPVGFMLAAPMAALLILFEWLRFGWGSDTLQLGTVLQLLSVIGIAAMAFVVLGLRYATSATEGVPLIELLLPDNTRRPQLSEQRS